MKAQLEAHWRLILLAGVALGLAIIFLLSGTATGPAPDQPKNQQNEQLTEPEPPEEPVFEFPGGGQTLLPTHRFIALYGNPETPALGSLGEQPLEQAIARVKQLAEHYQTLSTEKIYPAFEIISSIASASPTENGDYSRETSIEKLKPWVDAAKVQGVYIVLDLQPGYTDFLTQAKYYEPLLKEPHVGLALDPEWRLKPGQKHLKQIGSVSAAEINSTAAWLADLTKQHDLPQKLLLLHQFKLSMITERETLDTARPELAWCIQMDGLGVQSVKQDTWRNIRANPPINTYFGWKNFIDEDKPMLTPEETMTRVDPKPYFVSYQ